MAVEEMAELTQVLMKYSRKINNSTLNEIIEEIVDVEIMLEQLKIIFIAGRNFASFDYHKIRDIKLKRLKEMLEEVRE
ncbi:MAG TPA: hypothetical protein ENI53_01495 [Thermoplasmatales archaeon]|nr:hypothetical protein [Thermoplasmatales archaeon]